MRRGQDKGSERRKTKQERKASGLPVPGWEGEVPSPPSFGAESKPPAPEFASSSSVCMGSVLGALAGDAPRGGVVDGGGVLGVALCGTCCCCSPPAYLARSAPKCRAPDTCRWGKSDELTLGAMPGAAVRAAQHHQWRPRSTRRALAACRGLGPLHPPGQRLRIPAKVETNQNKRHRLRRRR